MSRVFEVEMAVYAWGEVFQVTSLFKERSIWFYSEDVNRQTKITPFAVTKALELKDGLSADDIAAVLWPTSVRLRMFVDSVLTLVDLTSEEINKKRSEYNDSNNWFIITWVQEVTIH